MYTHSVQLITVSTNAGLSSWLGPKPCREVEGKKKASPVQPNKLKRPLKPPEKLVVTVEAVPVISQSTDVQALGVLTPIVVLTFLNPRARYTACVAWTRLLLKTRQTKDKELHSNYKNDTPTEI